MEKLINLLDELSQKYKFEESDVKRIQAEIFAIQKGEDDVSAADLDKDDFQTPEGYEGDDDGLSADV